MAISRLDACVEAMERAGDDHEQLVHWDQKFHSTIFEATANATMASIVESFSGKTVRARVWRGVIEGDAAAQTLREHRAIRNALAAHDRPLAEAAALLHVNTSERWLREVLGIGSGRDALPSPPAVGS